MVVAPGRRERGLATLHSITSWKKAEVQWKINAEIEMQKQKRDRNLDYFTIITKLIPIPKIGRITIF